MKDFNTLDDFNFEEKTVLLRVDFNMPLDKKTFEILDTTRIKLVLPTITELVEKNAKVIILAHQGRMGSWDFVSMEKHAQVLSQLLGKDVKFINDIYGDIAKEAITRLRFGDVLFLDNVRQVPYETEKKTVEEHARTDFVQALYPLADYFVNDAFAAAHRPQCSLIGFTEMLPSCAGRLMEKELTTLEKVVLSPEKPCVFLFGGAKFSDVFVTIERILRNKTADKVLLSGLPGNAFLKSQGRFIGKINEKTLLDEGSIEQFEEINHVYTSYKDDIYLPIDFAIDNNGIRREIGLEELPTEKYLFDIGEKTIQQYKEVLKDARTVFLSGPCGVFENQLFKKGTEEIFRFVAKLDAFSIVGGGHTVAAVEQLHLKEKISHISTGGGSLEKYMMGEKLPVVESLKAAKQKNLINYN